MKLLSPQPSKNNKEAENIREILRTQDIQKASDKARKNLANAEADFKTSLSRFKEQWALEEETHSKRVSEMTKEVEILEEKKKQALIPIKIYEEEVKVIADEVMKRGSELVLKEEEINTLREKLEDKLDSLGQREQDVALKEQKQALQQSSIESQSLSTVEGIKRLNEQIEAFIANKETREKELKDRETAIILQERTIDAEKESLKRKEKGLSEWAIRLSDERGILDRAWNELKKKSA